MAEQIRLKVWILGLLPAVVVVGAVVAVFVASGKRAPPARAPLPTVEAPPTSPAPVSPAPTETNATSASSAPAAPPVASLMASYAPAASSVLLRGPPPEPIPELDALARPRGSEQWTAEQKLAYRQRVFDDLDSKERSLEREIASARRSGDLTAFREKTDTLAYLRARRAQVEEMLRRHDARLDAGS